MTVAGISVLGFVTSGAADSALAERLVGLLMESALIVAIAVWVRANRVAIALADEPPGTKAEPIVSHVVPSRRFGLPRRREAVVDVPTPCGKVVRLHPENTVVLPYDLR